MSKKVTYILLLPNNDNKQIKHKQKRTILDDPFNLIDSGNFIFVYHITCRLGEYPPKTINKDSIRHGRLRNTRNSINKIIIILLLLDSI
jgi:hypothetical protein